jgi:hypothetical protein
MTVLSSLLAADLNPAAEPPQAVIDKDSKAGRGPKPN